MFSRQLKGGVSSWLLLRLCRTKSRSLQSLAGSSNHCPHHFSTLFDSFIYTWLFLINPQNFDYHPQQKPFGEAWSTCICVFFYFFQYKFSYPASCWTTEAISLTRMRCVVRKSMTRCTPTAASFQKCAPKPLRSKSSYQSHLLLAMH